MTKVNKRFYWIQLNRDFFNSKEMKLLRKIAGGDTYTIIYLKLMLLSLEDKGKIYYEGLAKTLAEELSLVIDEKTEDIEIVLSFLENKSLMTRMPDNEYFLEQVPEMTGSETASTRRSRRFRDKKALQCNTGATQVQHLCNGDIDIDIDIDKDIDKDIHSSTSDEVKPPLPYSEIISYLNEKARTNYRASGKKTRQLIKARFNEGFKLDDFKKVIDIKASEWLNSNMSKYLRPETLFGTKFESYLNQQQAPQSYLNQIPDYMPF